MGGDTIEEKSKVFVNLSREKGYTWAFNNILKFMQFQLDRTNRKVITGSTVRNYVKSIKTLDIEQQSFLFLKSSSAILISSS